MELAELMVNKKAKQEVIKLVKENQCLSYLNALIEVAKKYDVKISEDTLKGLLASKMPMDDEALDKISGGTMILGSSSLESLIKKCMLTDHIETILR